MTNNILSSTVFFKIIYTLLPLPHPSSFFPTRTFPLPHTWLSHFPIQLQNLPSHSHRSNFIFSFKDKKITLLHFSHWLLFFLLFLLLLLPHFSSSFRNHPSLPPVEPPMLLSCVTTTAPRATIITRSQNHCRSMSHHRRWQWHVIFPYFFNIPFPFVFFHICSFFFFLRLFFLFFVHGWIVEGGWCWITVF